MSSCIESSFLSESLLWSWQKQVYEKEGPKCWSLARVPSTLTTSPALARLSARLAAEVLKKEKQKVGIIDLGVGSGRFAFLFLQALQDLFPSLENFVYLALDCSEKNLRALEQRAECAPFIQKGLLKTAVYSPSMQTSNAFAAIENCASSLVFANYFFDSLPQELLSAEGKKEKISLFLSSDIDRQDPVACLSNVKVELPKGDLQLFPSQALSCLEEIPTPFVLLSADKGFFTEKERASWVPFPLARHHSISLPVNYRAIASFFSEGFASVAQPADPSFLIFCASSKKNPSLQKAFREIFSHSLYRQWQKSQRLLAKKDLSFSDLLTNFQEEAWDPSLLFAYGERLKKIPSLSSQEKKLFSQGLRQSLRSMYPLSREDLSLYILFAHCGKELNDLELELLALQKMQEAFERLK